MGNSEEGKEEEIGVVLVLGRESKEMREEEGKDM